MDILLWLVPSGVVLVIAMAWAAWAGRPRREENDRSEAAYEQFARAIAKQHPGCRTAASVARSARPQHRHRRQAVAQPVQPVRP